MTGSPLLRVLLLVGAFLLAALPLVHLTSSNSVAAAPVDAGPEAPAGSVHAILRVRFAAVPETLTIRQGEHVWLDAPAPDKSPLEQEIDFIPHPAGIEVSVSATWPAGTPETALEVELEPDGLESARHSLWTDSAEMEQLVVFQWK